MDDHFVRRGGGGVLTLEVDRTREVQSPQQHAMECQRTEGTRPGHAPARLETGGRGQRPRRRCSPAAHTIRYCALGTT
jgi:hypothetical protein